MRRRAEWCCQQLDVWRTLRQGVPRDLLAESREHQAWKRLCQIPSMDPTRAAVLLGILQTPHRFQAVHSSADHEVVRGQLRRKQLALPFAQLADPNRHAF